MDFPKTFKDSLNREWTVEFGLPVESRMEKITGYTLDTLLPEIDPQKPKDGDEKKLTPLQQMMANPRRLFDLFYALIKPQADKLNLTREQVEEGFDTAEAIESMTLATLGSVTNFTRWNPLRRWVIPAVIAMGNRILRTQTEALKNLAAQVEKMTDADIGKVLAAQQGTPDDASIEKSALKSTGESALEPSVSGSQAS